MSTGGHDAYLESEILQADGFKLIQIMYRSALDSLAKARVHLAQGEIDPRSHELAKTSEILNELALAVNHDSGDMGRNLTELYDYIQTLLHDANFKQIEPPLAEAEKLLSTLLEGWENCNPEATGNASSQLAPVSGTPEEHSPVNCLG